VFKISLSRLKSRYEVTKKKNYGEILKGLKGAIEVP
jgi:hypothetical protein